MLPFKNLLNNDNPISDSLNLEELHTWYYAALLIGSNLFGIPLIIYGHRHALFVLSMATLGAVIVSILYHTCQTTSICFGFHLSVLTLADHVTAPLFMMAIILFIINMRSVKQRRSDLVLRSSRYEATQRAVVVTPQSRRVNSSHYVKTERYLDPTAKLFSANPVVTVPPSQVLPRVSNGVVSGVTRFAATLPPPQPWEESKYEEDTMYTQEEVDDIEARKVYNHIGYGYRETNDENNAWGIYTLMASFYIVFLAALAHNFSMQAFLISLSFGLVLIFFKIVIIDEGLALNMYHRISLPDLLFGVLMLALSLLFYILDMTISYGFTHTMWHVLSFLGIYFIAIGLTRNVENWYSPIDYCRRKTLQCCLKEHEEGPV